VVHPVEPRVLYQDIEVVQEGPSGRAAAGIGLGGVSDKSVLPAKVSVTRLSWNVTRCTITEVIGTKGWLAADGTRRYSSFGARARYTGNGNGFGQGTGFSRAVQTQ
jgi:hypothetical protein